MIKQYAERDAFELDQAGGHYMRHVMAMTAEQLHSKSDIAAELAWRDSQIAALQQKLGALAAENAALKSERAQMVEIGELIRTQDNRITDQPFFAVMTKREIVGSEDHDYDRICWVENQSGDYVEATETQHRRLEAIYQGKYQVREGWDRYAMKDIDVFVTGCFTEQGCKDYISRNAHNLNKPFIYAFGSYRNNEYQAVRKFIMDLPETPATDAYLNSVRKSGGPSIQEADLKALMRFNETSEDGEGYDISDDAMSRLVELGLVAKERGKMRIITSFGMWVVARENGEKISTLETQRDRDLAFQQRIAQLRSGTHDTANKAG